ncbi:MAG: hypothetical protein ACK58T_21310, partial [Phycisphaerae bacterium]
MRPLFPEARLATSHWSETPEAFTTATHRRLDNMAGLIQRHIVDPDAEPLGRLPRKCRVDQGRRTIMNDTR